MQNDLHSPCSLMGQPCQRTTKIMRNNASAIYNTSTPQKGGRAGLTSTGWDSWCVPSLPAPTQTTHIGKPKQAYGAFPVVTELQRGRACCETSYWKQSWWTGHIKLHPLTPPHTLNFSICGFIWPQMKTFREQQRELSVLNTAYTFFSCQHSLNNTE